MGSANCTRAVWNVMREQQYGRIVMTTSCSGLFGNFGQANYAAAKMGLVGLMQTLGIEGEKHNIRVNCLAPTGATRMMEGILPPEQLSKFKPELVSPAVLALVSEQAPNRAILSAGAGSFELVQLAMTQGIALGEAASAEDILQQWSALSQRDQDFVPTQGFDQARHELNKGGFHFEA
jgi:NAD(P)-dependent dehydrogenase (short-subunit alcohol dehydrogenase family)